MIKNLIYIILSLTCSFLHSQKQEQELDSIYINFQKKIENAEASKKLELLIEAGNYYFLKSPSKSNYYFLKANTLIKDNDDSEFYGLVNSKLGVIEEKKGNFHKSLAHLNNAKIFYTAKKDSLNLALQHIQIGFTYRHLKVLPKAKVNFDIAYNIAKKTKTPILLTECYNAMGIYFLRDYKVKKDVSHLHKLDSSLSYFKKALIGFKTLKSTDRSNMTRSNISVVYGELKQYTKAIKLREEIIVSQKKNNDLNGVILTYYNLGFAHMVLKNYEKSLRYIDSSLNIAKKEGYKYRISRCYLTKSRILYKMKQFERAYNNSILHKTHFDSIYNNKIKKKIEELELKNKVAFEKKKIELINAKKEAKTKFYTILFISILVLFIVFIIFFWQKSIINNKISQEKLEKEKLKKEVLAQKIKVSESELKSLIADNTMRLEFITQLSEQIKKDKSISESSTLKNYANSLLLKLQQQIDTENKLSTLKDKINSINQGFDKKIITLFPNLTKTEREVCSFLRLNLSIKEIASIRNVSTDSIKTTRYRIRKKMFLSKTQELEQFIQNIDI